MDKWKSLPSQNNIPASSSGKKRSKPSAFYSRRRRGRRVASMDRKKCIIARFYHEPICWTLLGLFVAAFWPNVCNQRFYARSHFFNALPSLGTQKKINGFPKHFPRFFAPLSKMNISTEFFGRRKTRMVWGWWKCVLFFVSPPKLTR